MSPYRLACLASLALAAGLQGQPRNPGEVTVLVVDEVTGAPVAGASVTMAGPALGPVRSPRDGQPIPFAHPEIHGTADGQGRAVIRGLPPGTYTLFGRAAGYLGGLYGASAPSVGSAPVEVQAGAKLSLRLRLWRAAAISGRVWNERDEPVAKARVSAYRWTSIAGSRRLDGVAARSSMTDDRGVYRLADLAPGEYVVVFRSVQITLPAADREARAGLLRQAGLSSYIGFTGYADRPAGGFALTSYGSPDAPASAGGGVQVYPARFFPNAEFATGARTFALLPGDEMPNVDLHLSPVETVRVSGQLIGVTGEPGPVLLRLTPAAANAFTQPAQFDAAATLSHANGTFSFVGVVPGQYAIRVLRQPRPVMPPDVPVFEHTVDGITILTVRDRSEAGRLLALELPNEPTWWANQPVSVGDRDVEDLTVPLHVGPRVRGRFAFVGLARDAQPPDVSLVGIGLESASGSPVGTSRQAGHVRIEPDGTFTSIGLPADRYLIRVVNLPAGWRFGARGAW